VGDPFVAHPPQVNAIDAHPAPGWRETGRVHNAPHRAFHRPQKASSKHVAVISDFQQIQGSI
jgi:hypothetical protein